MPSPILKSLKEFFSGNPAVRKVANDPALTAELMLLFRVMLADGRMQAEETAMFRRICETAFGIAADDIDKVTEYLQDIGYETTARQALSAFDDVPEARRAELVAHMRALAEADQAFRPEERVLIDKVAMMLGVAN
ncbi:MAG: TerB family tellurite resistance protein [Rhizobiaceae bacterium]|jgi:uncharacterized tellurite resistance protein B-like protein|nr:TerB family tellurite resistance protein [Rhizobiaceae bacterium]